MPFEAKLHSTLRLEIIIFMGRVDTTLARNFVFIFRI